MSQTPPARPEDRRRSNAEGLPALETLIGCMRSEAFAEDLPPTPDTRVPAPRWRHNRRHEVSDAAAARHRFFDRAARAGRQGA